MLLDIRYWYLILVMQFLAFCEYKGIRMGYSRVSVQL